MDGWMDGWMDGRERQREGGMEGERDGWERGRNVGREGGRRESGGHQGKCYSRKTQHHQESLNSRTVAVLDRNHDNTHM